MDKYLRFLRNISSDKNDHTPRARRRKMERELKKLNNEHDSTGDNGVDGGVSGRDEA